MVVMNKKIVIALDFDNLKSANEILSLLDPDIFAVKVGLQMFTLFGPDFVRSLVNSGFKVFLDLKFHDIPTTVANACKAAAELGVWMLNVHAAGGLPMLQASRLAINEFGDNKPLLIAVTVLTSFSQKDLTSKTFSIEKHVIDFCKLASQADLDGVVCSALEVPKIKEECGKNFLAITPGIRCINDNVDDQVRVVTPLKALELGSDYMVIGRPITKSHNPKKAIAELVNMLSLN